MARADVPEAELVETDAGVKPEGEGWFVVNLADAMSIGVGESQYMFNFEGPQRGFPHFGINVTVLGPGEPASMYHAEPAQEAFLVLQGECTAVVEDREILMRQWDFLHCPPNTAHVLVGAGEAPCAVLMVGARNAGDDILYPANRVASRHGASVGEDTDDPRTAYAAWPPMEPRRFPWPP